MQIIAKCPRCLNTQQLSADKVDKRIRCKNCRSLFKVPKLKELSKAAKVLKQAKSKIYVDKAGKTYG